MRQFAYETKSREDEDTWSPMLIVEKGFLDGATQEWNEVISLWDLDDERRRSDLKQLFDQAWQQAKDDTIDLLAERIPNIEDLLGTLEVSFEEVTRRAA